jgi:hypothetical protein
MPFRFRKQYTAICLGLAIVALAWPNYDRAQRLFEARAQNEVAHLELDTKQIRKQIDGEARPPAAHPTPAQRVAIYAPPIGRSLPTMPAKSADTTRPSATTPRPPSHLVYFKNRGDEGSMHGLHSLLLPAKARGIKLRGVRSELSV